MINEEEIENSLDTIVHPIMDLQNEAQYPLSQFLDGVNHVLFFYIHAVVPPKQSSRKETKNIRTALQDLLRNHIKTTSV